MKIKRVFLCTLHWMTIAGLLLSVLVMFRVVPNHMEWMGEIFFADILLAAFNLILWVAVYREELKDTEQRRRVVFNLVMFYGMIALDIGLLLLFADAENKVFLYLVYLTLILITSLISSRHSYGKQQG